MGLADWFSRTWGAELPQPASTEPFWTELEMAAHRARMEQGRQQARIASIVRSPPSRDEFAAWRDDPATRFVFAALRAASAEQKAAWDALAWEAGNADHIALTEYRARADAYLAMAEATYEDLCKWTDIEPEPLPDA